MTCGVSPSNSKIAEFINSLIASKDLDLSLKSFDSSSLIGQYKIVNVCQYPNTDYDCNEITCVKVDNKSVKIMIYQILSENHFRDWGFYNEKEIEDIEIIK